MRTRAWTHGEICRRWIEDYCLVPGGPDRGQPVRLTDAQRETIHRIYDNPNGPEPTSVSGELAAYLVLWHTCGPAAAKRIPGPEMRADIFTVWAATGPGLRAVLKRAGERIVCPELGTAWPGTAAA